MEFPKKLRTLMAKARLSQEAVARQLEVSQNLVSLWSRGKSFPDLHEAAKLAGILGVPLDYLADDSLDAPPEPAPPATAEETALIIVFRASGLGVDEAGARLLGKSRAGQREA